MFKKPVTFKPSSRMRSSDIRAHTENVANTFSIDPSLAKELVPSKTLRQSSFTSRADEQCVLYSSDDDPLFFTIEQSRRDKDVLLVPTVYTLSRYPPLLPTLTCATPVLSKLSAGADLMAPGLILNNLPPRPVEDDIPKGSLVAIQTAAEPGIPKAVGIMTESLVVLSRVQKGKAVLVLHTIDDHLWCLGTKKLLSQVQIPDQPTPSIQGEQPETTQDQNITTESENITQQSTTEDTIKSPQDAEKEDVIPPEEVTNVLRTALLLAIKRELSKTIDPFPIFASTLYSQYILPFRPVQLENTNAFDIKKSSYKKLSAWLKALSKEKLINVKELKGGEINVLSVNANHKDVVNLEEYYTIGDATKNERDAAKKKAERTKQIEVKSSMTKIAPMYKPHLTSLPLFEALQLSTSDLYTAPDAKTYLNTYITKQELKHPNDPAYIIPDQLLKKSILTRSKDDPSDASNKEFISRGDLADRLIKCMQNWHSYTPGQGETVFRKGPCPTIEILVKSQKGKQRLKTTISGLEKFDISPSKFAEQLQVICASSATTAQVSIGKGSPVQTSVVVLGDQQKHIVELLAQYGVTESFVRLNVGKK